MVHKSLSTGGHQRRPTLDHEFLHRSIHIETRGGDRIFTLEGLFSRHCRLSGHPAAFRFMRSFESGKLSFTPSPDLQPC